MRGTRLVVTGLKEKGLYKFRVVAFNTAGLGEPGEIPEALEVKDRTSMYSDKKKVIVNTYNAYDTIAYT